MTRFFHISILIFLFYLIVSCQSKTFYQKIDNLPSAAWNMDSILSFEFEITDSLQYYDFYIDIRNTTDYPYRNGCFFFTTIFPDSTFAKDTLTGIFSDAYGKWTGKGSGRIKENRFLLKKQVRFAQKGIYQFKAQQAMRDTVLKGITDFGMVLIYE